MTRFVRTPPIVGNAMVPPAGGEVKRTPSIWRASWADAMRLGGLLTGRLLDGCPLRYEHTYITVDTKIHMLMPGMFPSIPGWHTDGVPRQRNGSPSGGSPLLSLQDKLDVEGHGPRYHLLVTGTHCPTEFLTEPIDLDLTEGPDLYADMTRAVNARIAADDLPVMRAPDSTWLSWDWWNIHRAIAAESRGWRFLIRVTESDYLSPQTDEDEIVRLHNPVYIQTAEYGW